MKSFLSNSLQDTSSSRKNSQNRTKFHVGPFLRRTYALCGKIPGGLWVFSKLIGIMAPYSGSINARVIYLREGFAEVHLKDRRAVRNHLRCVHAVALMNLAEMATGLGICFALPHGARGILTHLEISYYEKARGPLKARAICPIISSVETSNVFVVEGVITNEEQEIVAVAKASWLIGPN
jgi:acyl-coenzyme A thioesterase PaaI-like protein